MKEENNDSKRISVQVNNILFEKINNKAHDMRMSRSEFIRLAILNYLKEK